jgi:hypothetical protein
MPWDVDVSLVEAWILGLDHKSYELVIAALELLEERGPMLGRPLVDSVKGSRHKNMKELRPGSQGWSELRVLFAFDPTRQAVLLVAGDKAGAWDRSYRVNIPLADDLLDRHLARLSEEGTSWQSG